MLLLGIDIETGAPFDVPHEVNFITELGAVLLDTDTNTPVQMMNVLIDAGKEIDAECVQYTGITTDMVRKHGVSPEEALTQLCALYNRCDYAVGHNGLAFDKPIIGFHIKNFFPASPFEKRVWVDTMIDVDYPPNCMNRSLTYLQGFHGFCYPGHRAIFDVAAMLRILMLYKLEDIIASANSPLVTVRATVNGYQDKVGQAKAKKNGFKWNPDFKTWTKEMRQIKVPTLDLDYSLVSY